MSMSQRVEKEWRMVNFKLGETNVKMKWSPFHEHGTKKKCKSPTGFEPTTSQTPGRPSIPLSYRELNWRVIYHFSFFQEEHLFREYHIVWYIFLYRNKNFVEIRIIFVRNTYTSHLVFTEFQLFLRVFREVKQWPFGFFFIIIIHFFGTSHKPNVYDRHF